MSRVRLTDGTVHEGVSKLAIRPAALYFTDKDGKRQVVSVNAIQQVEIADHPEVVGNEPPAADLPLIYRAPKEGEIATLPFDQ